MTEKPLLENEEQFHAIFQVASVGIVQVNPEDGRFLRCNERFCQITGYSQEELATKRFPELTHPEDRERDWEIFLKAAAGESRSFLNEKRYIRKDGGVIWVRLNAAFVRDAASRPLCTISICEDITERKSVEAELRKSKEELELHVKERTAELSAANRELRQRAGQLARLASELTLAEERERRRMADILHDHLQQILVAAKINLELVAAKNSENHEAALKTACDLIGESIQVSRTLTAELSPPILYHQGLAAALNWLIRWMDEKYELKVALDVDPRAVAEQEDVTVLLFHSVRELLFNVVKHAGVQNVAVRMTREGASRLKIVVSDQGTGFDTDKLWQTADSSGGFGLFTIRERLEFMGGCLEVQSSPGKGAAFTLTAPCGEGEKVRPKSGPKRSLIFDPAAASPVPGALTEPKRITRVLLVDDHVVIRKGILLLLGQHSDLQVAGEASDGEKAVQMARELQPDVILMDVSMPNMNGIEATRIIHAELPRIRVIGLSMFDTEDLSSAMMDAGAAAYCTKSGDAEVLLAAIRGQAQGNLFLSAAGAGARN